MLPAFAQSPPLRYRDPLFGSVDTTTDIPFGSAIDRYTQRTVTLRLDLHEPRGDGLAARPAIVLVHGGGFTGGNKAASSMIETAARLAHTGYLVASINYRLAPGGSSITPEVIRDAAHDHLAAVRWLRREAARLRIDPTRIAAIGSSAGAATILDAEYAADEGQSGNPGFDSSVAAIVDLWGFLLDPSVIDAHESPLMIVHGTDDQVVPYSAATALRDRAAWIGLPHELHPMQGSRHAPWNTFWQTEMTGVLAFLFDALALSREVGLTVDEGFSSPGTLTLRSHGRASDAWLLLVSPGTPTPIGFGSLGTLALDPNASILAAYGTFGGNPPLGSVATTLAVPTDLGGLALTWQGLQVRGTPRTLTNPIVTNF